MMPASSPVTCRKHEGSRRCRGGIAYPGGLTVAGLMSSYDWVAAKELNLSYHNPEAILFTMYPQYGNLI